MEKFTVCRNDDIYEAFADIARAADGTLVCTCRESMCHNQRPFSRVVVRRSGDGGLTWEGPEDTGITEGIVPSIKELAGDDLLIGVTEQFEGDDPGRGFSEAQTVYRSGDGGATWEGPARMPNPPGPTVSSEKWRLNEGDFAEMDDGRVVLYMREDGERLSAWKSLSEDRGRTWSDPRRSHMPYCHGRPSVGRLRSGEVAVTYRMSVGRSPSLALYVKTAAEAVRGLPGAGTRDMEDYSSTAEARFAVPDNDRSAWADSGYSG